MQQALKISFAMLPLTSSAAIADRDAGREVFRQHCIGCHAIECNRAGPKLVNIVGRTAGSVADFDGYSEAMKNSAIVWNEETLDAFLEDPVGIVPNNGMAVFGGLPDDSARQALIEFLAQPENSVDLCF